MKPRTVMRELGEFTAAQLGEKLAKLHPELNYKWVKNAAFRYVQEAEKASQLRRLPNTKPLRYRWWDLTTASLSASPRLPISASSATATPPHTSPPTAPSSCACPVPDR